jgi:hypothetical protein
MDKETRAWIDHLLRLGDQMLEEPQLFELPRVQRNSHREPDGLNKPRAA